MKTGFWEIAKINPTTAMIKNGSIATLSNIEFKAEEVNEHIRSREHYRINSEAMTNFYTVLKIYDQNILRAMSDLSQLIIVYQSRVQSTSSS